MTSGVGSSRGFSFTLEKKIGRTTGWITYALSKTNRTFALINNGESFPFDYDHRQDIKIVLQHRFSSRLDAGCTWVYHTGNYISYGNYMDNVGYYSYIYVQRNNYELPAYQRLDVDVNYHIRKHKLEHVITLGVYNAYNHKNIYAVENFLNYLGTVAAPNSPEYIVTEKTLFPIIPSLTYRINFQ